MEDSIKKHIESKADYTRNLDLPYGTSFECEFNILKTISQKDDLVDLIKNMSQLILNNRENFNILEINHGLKKTNFRFIDYPSDCCHEYFQYLSLRL